MVSRSVSGKQAESSLLKLVHMNDDAQEKVNRRKSSGKYSLVSVARDTVKNSSNAYTAAAQPQQPILANFEQWMKLVKDNKINATNSWNFALIDYFHDMSFLKEGNGINFQKASYTLDGCVKIYTSRVDSVASETGKLLSGLADSNKQQLMEQDDDDGEDGDGDGDDDEEGGIQTKKKKKTPHRSENTLVAGFPSVQSKKLELEMAIDPLFRKMCSDFDEGGAKGLLLNSLVIDKTGRVVFDGELGEDEDDDKEEGGEEEEEEEESKDDTPTYIDINSLRDKYFTADASLLESLQICPSMNTISTAMNDPALMSSSILKDLESMPIKDGIPSAFGDELDQINDEFGADTDDAQFENNMEYLGGFEDVDESNLSFGVPPAVGSADHSNIANGYGISPAFVLNPTVGPTNENDILSYFDETLKRNWAGPEHWKIRKLKGIEGDKPTARSQDAEKGADGAVADAPKRKERALKQQFVIDFLRDAGEVDEKLLFAEGGSTINLPKAQQKSKNRNLLPDDRHFSSKNLIKLFLKPRGRIVHSKVFGQAGTVAETEADAGFWAQQYHQPEGNDNDDNNYANNHGGDNPNDYADYDDYGGGYDGYTEARTLLPSPNDLIGNATRRARPEYLNYAKKAKRVNIKLLKNNIWNLLQLERPADKEKTQETSSQEEVVEDVEEQKPAKVREVRKFTEIAQDLKKVYTEQQLSEISTSFCFICVLHLANERGLVIEGSQNYDDLTIKWDPTATVEENI